LCQSASCASYLNEASKMGGAENPCSGGSPCFSLSSSACRTLDVDVSPRMAYDACFGHGDASTSARFAEIVPMSELVAGDLVLSADAGLSPSLTRVVVNQHAKAALSAHPMLKLQSSDGSLTLTPDHVLFVDGKFVPARLVTPGSHLSSGATVEQVASMHDGIINPVTANSKILAVGPEGKPFLSSTHPEWIAQWMLTSYYPLPVSVSSVLSLIFPATVQTFYDAQLEPILDSASLGLLAFKATAPALVLPAVAVLDISISAAFLVFSMTSAKIVAFLVASMAVKKFFAQKA